MFFSVRIGEGLGEGDSLEDSLFGELGFNCSFLPLLGSAARAAGPVHSEPAPHREGRAEVRPQLLVLHTCQSGEAAQHHVQVAGAGAVGGSVGIRGSGRDVRHAGCREPSWNCSLHLESYFSPH